MEKEWIFTLAGLNDVLISRFVAGYFFKSATFWSMAE